MNNDNTYKLAWGRAIVECVVFRDGKEEGNRFAISFDSIAHRMLKYYWNQLFFFHLKQSPYQDKDPVICKDTLKLIDAYKAESGSSIPIWFDEAENYFRLHQKPLFEKTLRHIARTLHENVSWRFKNVVNRILDIYELDKAESLVLIANEEAGMLNEYSVIISKLLNYKWAQLLEKYNYAPKISSKVNGISEAKLRRNDLSKYRKELLKEFEGKEAIDFYTGKPLKENDISIDHVIPWSFMYSDDIWNLVITSKSNNSSKSNSIPSKAVIEKLKVRNDRLEHLLSGNFRLSMEEAIRNKYVDKFYFE